MVDQCYYQDLLYGTVKNQDLWKSKKQKDYWVVLKQHWIRFHY